jgi:hypothetical protein
MLIPQINRDGAEAVFGSFYGAEGADIPKDAVCQLDITTAVDGNRVVQPNTSELNAVVGIAHALITDATYGLVQIYGYRSTAKVLTTDTSIAAGVKLVAVAGQDYLASSASGDLLFVLLQSHTTAAGTVSKKIHIRAM